MCGTPTGTAMEGADPEVTNWSEKVEDLVESGAIESAISFLETLILKLQPLTSTVAELQLTSALFELAKLYDSNGFSIRADEARLRALAIKNRSRASCDTEVARDEYEQVRASYEGDLSVSSSSTKAVPVNDGNLDKSTESQPHDRQPEGAISDDDWEDRADYSLDELLPPQQLPEVSKISLEDSVKEIPKRRGRGTFAYKKEGLYADQQGLQGEESVVCNSEKKVHDTAKEDSPVKNSVYGTRHVLVLEGFQPSYNTLDLENILKNFKDKFVIRWVNDTVALAVFISPSVGVGFGSPSSIQSFEISLIASPVLPSHSSALEASNIVKCPFSVRLLEEDDILMSSITNGDLEPPRKRPQTSARTAQRLIAQGMGIKIPLNFKSSEFRRQEEARKNRIVSRQNLKDDAWGPDD